MARKIKRKSQKVPKKITVDRLYVMIKGNRSQIDRLFDDPEGTLKTLNLGLPNKCYVQLIELIEKHRNSEWLERIKKEIEEGIWSKLPRYRTMSLLPPCPWGGCPPPTK